MPQLPGFHARRAALRMLDAVLRRGETLESASQAALRAMPDLADRALARAIAAETLRWLCDLDTLIDSATRKPLPHDAKARSVLRLMLAQTLRLETPPHAVIATALPLLAGGPRKLAHGVFASLIRREVKLPTVPALPRSVIARWGSARAQSIASGLAAPPPLDLTLRNATETQLWRERLEGETFAPGHIRLARGSRVENLPGYAAGAWWVQDFAASLPARLLGAGRGRRMLDMCAAPGGKTMQLSAAGWQVSALDVHERRLERLSANLARTGLAAEIIAADALTWQPGTLYDAIMLDAPCTATGTCRRHPDVLHRIGEQQIADMALLQKDLLTRASDWLKPGGQLVYAVCSLEPEEGEEIAASCTLNPDPITDLQLPGNLRSSPEGWVRTHPAMMEAQGGMDGFFIARWRK